MLIGSFGLVGVMMVLALVVGLAAPAAASSSSGAGGTSTIPGDSTRLICSSTAACRDLAFSVGRSFSSAVTPAAPAPSAIAVNGQLGERADRDAARALGLKRLGLVGPGRARDVEVRPRQAARELFEEHRRRDRAGRSAADVREIGDVAAQAARSSPRAAAAARGDRRRARRSRARRRPTSSACRRDRSSCGRARRRTPRSRWPRRPDAWRRPSRVRTTARPPRISRPSASVLSTSTVLPDAPRNTSPGFKARPPGMFSHVGTRPTTRIGALQLRNRPHRGDDGRTASHVVLHPVHVLGRLD